MNKNLIEKLLAKIASSIMINNESKRQKNFLKILKKTRKKFDCDDFIEKVKDRYEFNVYHNSKEDIRNLLYNYNVELISVSDEGGDFVVVREIKPPIKRSRR